MRRSEPEDRLLSMNTQNEKPALSEPVMRGLERKKQVIEERRKLAASLRKSAKALLQSRVGPDITRFRAVQSLINEANEAEAVANQLEVTDDNIIVV